MKTILIPFIATYTLFALVSCNMPAVQTEKPTESFPIAFDVSGFSHSRAWHIDRAVPITDDSFLYYINGWNDSIDMIARVYSFSFSGYSELLSETSDCHISRMFSMGDAFLLLLKDGLDDKTGLSLLCVDSEWTEKWKYRIDGGLVDIFVTSESVLFETYSLDGDSDPDTIVIIDKDGDTKIVRQLIEGEGILYGTHIIDEKSIFLIVRPSYDPKTHCILRVLNNDFGIIYEAELPFYPDEESIVKLTCDADQYLLFTNKKIYRISENRVTEHASAAYTLNILLKKDETLYPIAFYDFSNDSEYYYVGYIYDRGVPRGIVGLSYDNELSSINVHKLEFFENVLCSYVSRNGALEMIAEKESGSFEILRW